VFFYTHDANASAAGAGRLPQLRTLHRPANLEDLFLKLTGRQIREERDMSTATDPAGATKHLARAHAVLRFWPVFLRNLLVWRKLAIPSLVGNIAEPLDVAGGLRLRHGRAGRADHVAAPEATSKCPTSCFWPAARSA